MAPKGIKASKLLERKSKAKVIEWVSRKRSRGTRYVPVEVSTSKNPHTPRRDAVRMEIDPHEAVSHDNKPWSMEVEETFSKEESDIPEHRRVSVAVCLHTTISQAYEKDVNCQGLYDQRKAETSHAKPHSAHWSVPELTSLIQRPEEMSQCGEEKVSKEDKLDCYCVNYGVYIRAARLLTKLLRSVKE